MAISIISPSHSFVRFNEPEPVDLCIWGAVSYCLPVYEADDVAFQWVMQGTEEEIDALCTTDGSEVAVSIVEDCDGTDLIIFAQKPQRFRLSSTQVLYNWPHGVPGFNTVVDVNKCFKIKVTYGEFSACTNCFERVADDCYSSVLEYGNDGDAYGFKYCYGGEITSPPAQDPCEPLVIQCINQSTLSIPYTAGLKAQFGEVPTVQVWVDNGSGELQNLGITATFDGYPVNMINIDFGGPASGIVVIR